MERSYDELSPSARSSRTRGDAIASPPALVPAGQQKRNGSAAEPRFVRPPRTTKHLGAVKNGMCLVRETAEGSTNRSIREEASAKVCRAWVVSMTHLIEAVSTFSQPGSRSSPPTSTRHSALAFWTSSDNETRSGSTASPPPSTGVGLDAHCTSPTSRLIAPERVEAAGREAGYRWSRAL